MANLQKPTITLVFKGLMVFHRSKKDGDPCDVGILKVPGHKFRIIVTSTSSRGTKRSSISLKPNPGEVWRLHVQDPADPGIREYRGEDFDRTKEDFRWLINMESPEFHPPPESRAARREVKAELLNPIFRLNNGLFYTRVKSKLTERKRGDDPFEPFGFVAEAVGVDIELKSGNAVLVVEGTEEELFRLEKNGDVTHEVVIENSPELEDDENEPRPVAVNAGNLPVGPHLGAGHAPEAGHHHAPEAGPRGPARATALSFDHFQFYYEFFPEPEGSRFKFRFAKPVDSSEPPEPMPDPLLCPMVMVG